MKSAIYVCSSVLVYVVLTVTLIAGSPCIPRKFDQDSIVCVCNATYCDSFDEDRLPQQRPENPIPYWNAHITSRDGLRMDYKEGSFEAPEEGNVEFTVGSLTDQTVMGFGGAFTDAATITMNSLSAKARTNLINSYFSKTGIEYNLGRIPMASCDFSQRVYSYDDSNNDLHLEMFKLQEEDRVYKIPAMLDAMAVSRRNISFFASPWSSPYWMKTNNNMTGRGTIKGNPRGEYYKAWADYFVKFLQAYQANGIDIWGLTAQNEPTDGNIPGFKFQCLGWTPETQREFIANDLGPALEKNGFGHVKLMIFDDQRAFLPLWAEAILLDPRAAKYVSGIAVHWYTDLLIPTSFIDIVYKQFGKDYFILNTEACEQDLLNKNKSVELGNWYRGEHYFKDIMQDLKHGISGWVDWNMALNMEGGPNWVENRADSPIIVNAAKDEFYKQPMFYAMGHYSKFITPGSVLVEHVNSDPTQIVEGIFFKKDDGLMTANLVNIDEKGYRVTIKDPTLEPSGINIDIPAKSFITLQWWTNLK